MNKTSPRLLHRAKSYKQDGTICPFSFYSLKLSFLILSICGTLFILLQIQSLQIPPISGSASSLFSLLQQWQNVFTNKTIALPNCNRHNELMIQKLRDSVIFLPLKDLRYAKQPLQGHTWFMSSMYDTQEEGEVQYQQFPSESSKGRVLCLKGHDIHDGSWNYYSLAWPEVLPSNATLMEGLTFVAYNHYNFDNIWHGLSAVVPFVAWHRKNNCEIPTRWILYHWGEMRFRMGTWLTTLVEATFGQVPYIEEFNDIQNDDQPVCFEKAVVMRHNEGGMARQRRMEVYDLIRCKARAYCDVSQERNGDPNTPEIGMTLLMRTGARSFRNETAVIRIFEKECKKIQNCRITVAYSSNLTVCEQVKLMSLTDVLISPHGAQLTNVFLMDRNSSVMEFFPRGWLKLAGVGQYVYRWMSSWSGMKHQGAWRDPDGENCPFGDDDRRCMSIYKNGRIGYNDTHFALWARNVLNEVKTRKLEEASKRGPTSSVSETCDCT